MINEQKPVNQIQLARAVINTSAKAMNQYAMKIEQPIQNWNLGKRIKKHFVYY